MKIETYLVRCECTRVYLFACMRVRHVRYSNEYACPGYCTHARAEMVSGACARHTRKQASHCLRYNTHMHKFPAVLSY